MLLFLAIAFAIAYTGVVSITFWVLGYRKAQLDDEDKLKALRRRRVIVHLPNSSLDFPNSRKGNP